MADEPSGAVVGVPRESAGDENRVALVPAGVDLLKKAGMSVVIERGAGTAAGFSDSDYETRGATLVDDRNAVFEAANVVLQVRAAGANPEGSRPDIDAVKPGQVIIASCDPLSEPQVVADLAAKNATAFSLELVPRITRAQSMDILSSMATIAGYKAVLIAANALPRMFPMMMTAAGTISPAKVLVVGAGVAGLQAIASARRLGAVVSGYDIRPAVKEQVESLGAKFVELELETESSEGTGGYAKEMDDDFYRRQQELMTKVIAESDVVITTAAIPGRKAPVLVTTPMVDAMSPGSIVVDLAAERGGNCELTQAGVDVDHNGVTIIGPVNIPATIPYHASEMFSKNIVTFLLNLAKDGQVNIDLDDEIISETLLCRDGDVINSRVRDLLGLEPLSPPAEEETPEAETNSANSSGDAAS